MFFASAILLAAPVALAAGVDRLATRQSACSEAHVFLAKGNNEPYPGRQGKLVNAICSGLPSCDYEDIQFYNPVESDYCGSVNEGVANGIAQITAYNQRCPDTKLVVSGYSQGAQIVSDILGGGGGVFFQDCVETTSAGIDVNSPAGKKIAAAMVFGNLRHTANQPYNVLSGSGANGLFPRSGSQATALLAYTSVFHDYCVDSDPICAASSSVEKVVNNHLNYFDVYTDEAAAWVKSQLSKAASGGSAPPATTAVATPVPTVSVAPYPTSAYSNGTYPVSSYSAILPIPTAATTVVVSVPCVTLASSMVASYTSKYLSAVPTTVSDAPVHATTVAIVPVYPTATGTAPNGTTPFAGGAQGMAAAPVVGSFALALAGALLMV